MRLMRKWAALGTATAALVLASTFQSQPAAASPIKHVVVIFQENVSFDHYFATYPVAKNLFGESKFLAKPGTPSVNGLTPGLIFANPNSTKPFRLSRAEAATCDQDHDYTAEQEAFHLGLMDRFPEFAGVGGPGCPDYGLGTGLVMGYYDGSTTTALWNYAQNYSMSDNFFDTTFGPSSPEATDLISGQTHGATADPGAVVEGTVIGDPQPAGDTCDTRDTTSMAGKNVGDLLNAKGVTWGWFEDGFDLALTNPDGSTGCKRTHTSPVTGVKKTDYIPHHEPFQYFKSTANLTHARPSSVAAIGHTDAANHQYDIVDFVAAANAGNLPAVSYVKAAGYQDGHAGYSSPLDEQTFVVDLINFLQTLPEWNSMAIFITYDDSDGWYDHQMGPILSQSDDPIADALTGSGMCGDPPAGTFEGRCGYGPRMPLLAISPFARINAVSDTLADLTSVLQFVEDTFALGRIGGGSFDARAGSLNNLFDFSAPHAGKLKLDPSTGQVVL